MKLLEKLRWLPTEIPGRAPRMFQRTVECSPILVGETPGTSNARSEGIPAVERNRLNLGLRDGAGDLAARGFEYRRLCRHGHAGIELADREREIQVER